jgi:hypothetical protein
LADSGIVEICLKLFVKKGGFNFSKFELVIIFGRTEFDQVMHHIVTDFFFDLYFEGIVFDKFLDVLMIKFDKKVSHKKRFEESNDLGFSIEKLRV